MDWLAYFRDFGYPSLITGVLLWIITTKIEKMTASNIDLAQKMESLKSEIQELRNDVRDKGAKR